MADKPTSATSNGKQGRNGKKYLTAEDVLEALFNDSDSDNDEGELYCDGNRSIDEELRKDRDDDEDLEGISFVSDMEPCFKDNVLQKDISKKDSRYFSNNQIASDYDTLLNCL